MAAEASLGGAGASKGRLRNAIFCSTQPLAISSSALLNFAMRMALHAPQTGLKRPHSHNTLLPAMPCK